MDVVLVRACLNELLKLKRLCSVVHAIEHEVERVGKSGRKRKVKEPTGDYVVGLFVGGMLPCADDSERDRLRVAINAEIRELIDATLAPSRKALTAAIEEATSLGALKGVGDMLDHLESASHVCLLHGNGGLVSNPSGQVRFQAPNAQRQAQVFCIAMNKLMSRYSADAERDVRERLLAAARA